MSEIVALGSNEFVVGFQLAGVRAMETEPNRVNESAEKLIEDSTVGIVILGQETYQLLSQNMKERVLQSIKPVFVVLSEQESSEELRMLIKKSIGVDLWNKE
ncbi:MAG: V-type ATP synthase subunit F [Candidatus Woesearchaeota archaeon]